MAHVYIDEYKRKRVSVDEAAKMVKSGDWVEYGGANTCAHDFDEALSRRKDELWDVNIRCDIGYLSSLYCGG